MFPLENLSLKEVTEKLIMLLALGTGFRAQTISLIKLSGIVVSKSGTEIKVKDIVKTSRPGSYQSYTFLPFFNDKTNICIASTLKYYINVTSTLRSNNSNFDKFN